MSKTKKSSFFRSDEMSLYKVYIKKDAAYECICCMGELGLVQINNLNEGENVTQLNFVKQMFECSEMAHTVRFLRQEIEEAGITIPDIPPGENPAAPKGKEIVELRADLRNIENELIEITKNYRALKVKYFYLVETNAVLEKADEFFYDASILAWSDSMTKNLLMDTNDLRGAELKKQEEGLKLGYLTGTIPMENFFAFERVLWRVCRGNFFIRHAEIEETFQNKTERKFVFMVFFQGQLLEKKIRKICQGFQTALYQCPESSRDRLKHLTNMDTKIRDLGIVLEQTDYHRRRVLTAAAADVAIWQVRVQKGVAVYHIMNHLEMDDTGKYLIAECWMPTADVGIIQKALYNAAKGTGTTVPPILTEVSKKGRTPPTFNRTNRFIHGFQMLVDAYGVGNYRELNPAPYTIVTFPFLFAIMFGDFGHGVLVSLFSSWMVAREKVLIRKKINNEIWNILFGGRYIILAMGIYSIYAGLVYNEIFSKSFSIFATAWSVNYNESTALSNHQIQLDPATCFRQDPYIFGLDPIWEAAGETSIIMLNSFKMKVAIILGVVHMFFGMTLSCANDIFFGSKIDLLGVALPQMVFFTLFLYLAVLILLKWTWYSAINDPPYNTSCAPSILITFINMLLFKSEEPESEDCKEFMFSGQQAFQKILVFVALGCIPVMLLAKPMYTQRQIRRRQKHRHKLLRQRRVTFSNQTTFNDDSMPVTIDTYGMDESSSSSSFSMTSIESMKEEELDITELYIHQAIHTIECVLGSVSHTASYLRLWALSLAHDQLSGVLWDMVLSKGLKSDNATGGIILYFTFGMWAVLTLSILVVMEGLSAFLHTLRLHWVEFQSKFYEGAGTPFEPFDFQRILKAEDLA